MELLIISCVLTVLVIILCIIYFKSGEAPVAELEAIAKDVFANQPANVSVTTGLEQAFDYLVMRTTGYDKLRRYVALDVETTGLDPLRDRIVQIAVLELNELLSEFGSGASTELSVFNSYFNPECPIPEEASNIHGIYDADVAEAPRFEDYSAKILDVIRGAVIVGHNVEFDMNFVNAALERAGRVPLTNDVVCTLKLSRKLLPGTSSYRLNDLAQQYKIAGDKAHDAMSDAIAAGRLYALILRRQFESLRNPPAPQMIEICEGIEPMEESEFCCKYSIVEPMRVRPYQGSPSFNIKVSGVTYQVNLSYGGEVYSIAYPNTYGWSEMTPRHKYWRAIKLIARVYNPTTVARYSSEVKEYAEKSLKPKSKNNLSEINERFGFNGVSLGHLKITSTGTYYFPAQLNSGHYVINFDVNKEFSYITSEVMKDGKRHEVVMRKGNPRYEVLAKMAEKYNPTSVRPRKSSSR